jgi:hypothetical protein
MGPFDRINAKSFAEQVFSAVAARTFSVPPQIAQIASSRQLGVLQDVHPWMRRVSILAAIGVTSVPILGLFLGWLAVIFHGDLGFVLSSLLLIGLSIVGFVSRRRLRNAHVYVYQHGLIREVMEAQVFRWDEIETVWQRAVTNSRAFYTTTYTYRVQRRDGIQVRFPGAYSPRGSQHYGWERVKQLGTAICQQVAQAQWDQTIETYKNGQSVFFGGLSLSQEGLRMKEKALSWDEVESITLEYGIVIIEKRNPSPNWWNPSFTWLRVEVAGFPNLDLFWSLTGHVRRSKALRFVMSDAHGS